MWRYVKWGFRLALLAVVAGFLHYTLPQRDVVRIINTYNRVTPIGANWMFYSIEDSGTGSETTSTSRDIRFIDAVFPDGKKVITYRNEDTGWVWPPYFKWDSSTLQAEATNLRSEGGRDRWVAVTHYGWRMPIFSIYPNAVKVVEVSGPDVRLIPWFNIVVLLGLAFAVFMIWRMLAQFRERVLDPAADNINRRLDEIDSQRRGVWGRFTGWLDTWRGKPRR